MPSIVSAGVQSLCEEKQLQGAVDVLMHMDQHKVIQSVSLYRSVLKACWKKKSLAQAKGLHAHLASYGLETSRSLGEHVVVTLVKCGALNEAVELFHRLSHRTAFSWTALISGYVEAGQGQEALRMYLFMLEEGVEPNNYTFVSALKACSAICDLEQGKRIHLEVTKHNYEADMYVRTSLVDMYGKCGHIGDARDVFDSFPMKNVVLWNAMLAAYVHQGEAEQAFHLYEQMTGEDVSPDDWTFVSILQACGMLAEKEEPASVAGRFMKQKSLRIGKAIHAVAQRKGCISNAFVGNTLVSMYGKCGSIVDAHNMFDRLSKREVVSWNALLAAYAYQGEAGQVLQLYEQMQEIGVTPNDRTRNTLVSAYGKYGRVADAQLMFDRLVQRDLVSWNSILVAYTEQGDGEKALQLYVEMRGDGLSPDAWTLVSVLQACGMIAEQDHDALIDSICTQCGSLWKAKAFHAYARCKGYDSNVWVCNALIRLYGKCGSISDAADLFRGLLQRSVASWNALLAVYAQQTHGDKALQLYMQMMMENVSADASCYVAGLQSCGMLAERNMDGGGSDASCKFKLLEMGRAIHAEAWRKNYTSCDFLGSTLVSMYSKFGCFADAEIAFDVLPQKNVVVWTAILRVHVEEGKAEKVFQMYQNMIEEGVSPDTWTYVSLLQACCLLVDIEGTVFVDGDSLNVGPLYKGKVLHAVAASKSYGSSVFVGNALLTLYGKCGSIVDAESVFDVLPQRDVVSWNALLTTYVERSELEKGLQLYGRMKAEHVRPTVRTFVGMLQACNKLAEIADEEGDWLHTEVDPLDMGRAIHADAQRMGCVSDVYLAGALIGMYRKCGSIVDAESVFDGLSQRDVVLWNGMLAAYGEQGQGERVLQLYKQMLEEGAALNVWTFVSVIQACGLLAELEEDVAVDRSPMKLKSLERAKVMHAEAQKYGYDVDGYVSNTLVSVYSKCRSILDSVNVFDRLFERDVISWNALLAALVEHGQGEEVLLSYGRMQNEGMSPDAHTIVTLLQALGMLAETEEVMVSEGASKVNALARGKEAHAEARRRLYDRDMFVAIALVSMYGKCGSIIDAQHVFGMLSQQGDVMLWNSMLTAYCEAGLAQRALQSYEEMVENGGSPDVRTLMITLQSCSMLACVGQGVLEPLVLGKGKAMHAEAERKGYTCNVFVGSTLIRMYAKCGSIPDARSVFNKLSRTHVASWNAMFAAYVEQGQAFEALQLYEQMQEEGVRPDGWTFVSILQACGMLAEKEEDMIAGGQRTKAGSIQRGRAIHSDVRRSGWDLDVFVGNSLISMYGKCGSMTDARAVFDGLPQRDVVSWNAMLAAYVGQDQGETALELFKQMQEQGACFNNITLLCILQACCSSGNLPTLRQIHHLVVFRNGQDLNPFLASGLISAYGRCGSMLDARRVFDAQPRHDCVSWNALISGYAKEGSCAASLQCFEEMLVAGTDPDRVTFLSLLSACSHAGLVDTGVQLFESMSRDFNVTPAIEHYVTIVDLLGRAGWFRSVADMLAAMPMQPNQALWLCLLGACQKYGRVALGEEAFRHAVRLQPKHPAPYLLMSNIYADAGLPERARRVKQLRQKEGAWKLAGQSWIGQGEEVHSFWVEDSSHAQRSQLYELLGKVH